MKVDKSITLNDEKDKPGLKLTAEADGRVTIDGVSTLLARSEP